MSAQQTGTLAGVVRDAQGAVLPGVAITIAGPSLAAAPRTATTGDGGAYSFAALPPGVYEVTYELAGFSGVKREGVRVQVAVVTRLDTELALGGLEETVIVSGESPVVDVSSTTSQTNIDKELYEAIPTGRNPWVMAGLVPGVITGRLDVGGTEGMQQYNLEVFGSADSQKSFSIDGLKTNWPGGDRRVDDAVHGFEMYDEYNMQTASGTAESDVAGIYMNMVTKSGTNRYRGETNYYFMNDSLQGDNVDDELRLDSACSRASRPAPPATRSTSRTTGAPRSGARSSRIASSSSPPIADGVSTSSRLAPPTPMDRRRSTTTASRTTWGRGRGRSTATPRPRSCSIAISSTASTAGTRPISSSKTRRRSCRTSRRRTSSSSSTA